MTVLQRASVFGRLNVTKLLVHRRADIDKEDRGMRRNPLWGASRYGHMSVVRFLVEHGADINHRDMSGKLPEQAARMHHHTEVAEYLERAHATGLAAFVGTMSKPEVWLSLAAGVGLSLVLTFAAKHFSKGPATPSAELLAQQREDPRFRSGAWRLASKTVMKSTRGTAVSSCNRLERFLDVAVGGFVLWGVFSYFCSPLVTCTAMALLFAAPAWLRLDLRATLRAPVLASGATSTASSAFACLRSLALACLVATFLRRQSLGLPPLPLKNGATYNEMDQNIFFQNFSWDSEAPVMLLHFRIACCVDMAKAFWGLCWAEFSVLCLHALIVGLMAPLRRRGGSVGVEEEEEFATKHMLAVQIAEAAATAEPLVALAALGVQHEIGFSLSRRALSSVDALLVFVFLDAAVFDVATIYGMLDSGNYRLATCMTAVVSCSLLHVLQEGTLATLWRERRETIRTGVMTQALADLFDTEMGFEAFFSLMITSYSLPFIVTTPLQLIQQCLSMLYSAWGLSDFLHRKIDLEEHHSPRPDDDHHDAGSECSSAASSSDEQSRDASFKFCAFGGQE